MCSKKLLLFFQFFCNGESWEPSRGKDRPRCLRLSVWASHRCRDDIVLRSASQWMELDSDCCFFCSASYSDILWLLIPQPGTLYCWGSRWQPLSALVFCLPSLVAGSLPLCISLKFAEFLNLSPVWAVVSILIVGILDRGGFGFSSICLQNSLLAFLLLVAWLWAACEGGFVLVCVGCFISIVSCEYLLWFASCVFVTNDNNEMFCVGAFQIKVLVVQSTSTTTTKL